jgi:tRNA(fMet)-specific endonuclease VapC
MAFKYLMDTNICIYIAKHHPPEVLQRFETLQVGDVAMSIITFGELQYGAEKSSASRQAKAKLDRLSELVPVLSLPPESAQYYGTIRARLEQAGTPIGAKDLWIAAHALAENLVLVTNNTREFKRVPDLIIENWVSMEKE